MTAASNELTSFATSRPVHVGRAHLVVRDLDTMAGFYERALGMKLLETSDSGVELGAGWSRTARETGAEYLSLKLDDPSFTAPVYASLVQGDKGEHKLIWSR